MQERVLLPCPDEQIREMWDAFNDTPQSDPQWQVGYEKALDAEAQLRKAYAVQEQLRDLAPEMMELLKKIKTALDGNYSSIPGELHLLIPEINQITGATLEADIEAKLNPVNI